MVRRAILCLISLSLILSIAYFSSGCKSCKKDSPSTPAVDSTATTPATSTINLPHADTALIPILSAVLEEAFQACEKKDYKSLGALIVYRGPDQSRYGTGFYDPKNSFDKNLMRITADVMNKWNREAESKEYVRVFELDQPDGRKLVVLEVLFISRKNLNRKFFGFLDLNGSYKIADVTSYL